MKDKPIFFISFIGRRDPRNNGEDGPILTLLKQKDFINTGRVLLLYTSDMEKNAEETSKCIVKLLNLPPEKVEIRLLEVSSPVDWEEVYNKVKDTIIDISDLDKYNCYLNLSSGTPQMQGSFFLIGMSGVIEAELIYQPDPKFSKEPKKINRASTKLPYILPRIERSYRKEEIDDELDRIRKNIGIIGENPLLIKALKKAQRYARGDENILIKGESGTGKELFARLIHELSNRAKGPFKSINCAAIPEQLLESELFGYKKGAFTGANRDYPGLFKVCDKGTIFLDEIGDLSLNLQAKLLRAVENKEIKHLGDENIIKVDVRIITATHKNLEEMVREGKFREDLYYRIGILTIPLPALRERKNDIPLIVEAILQQEKTHKKFSEEAIAKLQRYSWRGNIRELLMIIKRAIIDTDNEIIGPDDIELPSEIEDIFSKLPPFPYEGFELDAVVEEIRDYYYKKAVELAENNLSKAAKLVGCTAQNLHKWMRRHSKEFKNRA